MNPEILLRIFDRPIAFHRCLVGITGSVNAALLLGQLIYWTPRSNDKGWIYKTADELETEIGLGRREQETARRALRAAGFVTENKKGIPPKIYFLVDISALHLALERAYGGEMPRQPAPTSNLAESAKLISPNPPNQFGALRQNNTETTNIEVSSSTALEKISARKHNIFSILHGLHVWTDADRVAADTLLSEFGDQAIVGAVEKLELEGWEPLPSRVKRKLEQLARDQRAATKRASAATLTPRAPLDVDPDAQAAGAALLTKIRQKKSKQNQGAAT